MNSLTEHEVVFPFDVVLERDPRADGVEVVVDHGDALAEADDVVVAGDEVKALVVNLAKKQIV